MEHAMNSIVLLTSCTVSSVIAFGPQLELVSHTNCCAQHEQISRLYASKPEAKNRRDQNKAPRSRPVGFHFVPAPFDGLDDFSFSYDHIIFDGTFQILQEQADSLALETFEEFESFGFDGWDNCADDCKECEIPKDWCVPGETINVMDYLGVTRVKPLC